MNVKIRYSQKESASICPDSFDRQN